MGIYEHLLSLLVAVLACLPDPRSGRNITYSGIDLSLSAFACFFSQDKSFLQFQKRMEDLTQKSNLSSLFNVKKVPSDDQIRNFLDSIDPKYLYQAYYNIIKYLLDNKALDIFNVLHNQYKLIALDGTKYFSSTKIHCPNCNIIEHSNGTVEYCHYILGASLVSPNLDIVIPLPPENTVKNDGNNKQDCEQNAIKRWLTKNSDEITNLFKGTKIIILADALHSKDPLISTLLAKNINFILNCKNNSHKDLFEYRDYVPMNEIIYYDKVKNFKEPIKHSIQWLNNLSLYDKHESNKVNFVILTIYKSKKVRVELLNEEKLGKKKKKFYTKYEDTVFSFVSDIEVTENNVKEIVRLGRSRWKIENNNFNILKHGGYHIEHNFGHGKNFLSATLITLNILAFLFHSSLQLLDELWIKTYNFFNNRKVFFDIIKVTLRYFQVFNMNDLLESINKNKSPPSNNIDDLLKRIKFLEQKVDFYEKLDSK